MNFIERFKSLPVSSRRLLGIGVTLALVVALPLFIWAIVTQNFNSNKRAASGEPVECTPKLVCRTDPCPILDLQPGQMLCSYVLGDISVNGMTISVNYKVGNPGIDDWVQLHEVGTDSATNRDWKWLNDSRTKPNEADLKTAGTITLNLPTGAMGKSWEVQYYTIKNGAKLLVENKPVILPPINMSALLSNNTVVVSFDNPLAETTDWIGLYLFGSTTHKDWRWLDNTKTPYGTGSEAQIESVNNKNSGGLTYIPDNDHRALITQGKVIFNLTAAEAAQRWVVKYTSGNNIVSSKDVDLTPPLPSTSPTLNCNAGCGPVEDDYVTQCGQGLSCLNIDNSPNIYDPKCRNPQCPSQTNCICPTPAPIVTPIGSGFGNSCNGICSSNSNCQSGLICTSGNCRNPLCAGNSTCICTSPTPTPPPTVTGTGKILIKVKFAGVADDDANGAKIRLRIFKTSSYVQNGQTHYTYYDKTSSPFSVNYVENGVYEGLIQFEPDSNVYPGENYTFFIKGEKHISRKFCQQTGQTLPCGTRIGQITLYPANSPDTAIYDLTGLALEPGDLPEQDGVVDSKDFAKITSLLGKPSTDITNSDLYTADLNYDNKVNVQDVILLRKTLETKSDEE